MADTNAVLIAGGGIGGLSTALGLARVGVPCIVLERASRFGEIGAGIQLGPNAFRSFDHLGIGDAARALAVYVESMKVMDAVTAEEIVTLPLDEGFRARFQNPYAVVHRGELHGIMQRACEASPLIELRTNSQVVSYSQDGDGVSVTLANGAVLRGAALVGADGLRSAVRAQLVKDGEPRVSGHTTYRSVIPTEEMPEDLRWNAMTIWMGPKCHIVHYPLSDWKAFNLVITKDNGATEAAAGTPVSHEEVRANFGHIDPKPLQIIERGRDWKFWVLCDREPIANWRDGRVVLLGDAAHPMLQYLAQGACMAMEDAVRLSHEVQRCGGDFAKAFEAYRVARVARASRVQTSARQMGEDVFHVSGDRAKTRNERLRAMSTTDFYDVAAWLYDGSGLS